ncbi:hypothetical protein D3C73_1507920 [compost metagenome]
MKDHNIWNLQTLNEGNQVFAAFSAIDSELMLDDEEINIGEVKSIGCFYIVRQVLLIDFHHNLIPIVVRFLVVNCNNMRLIKALYLSELLQ